MFISKKTAAFFCGCILIFSMSTCLAFCDEIGAGVINGSGVNMRDGAGTNYKVVVSLNNGTKISILDKSGDWYKVSTSDNIVGWVNKDFISQTETIGKVTASSLNLRNDASTSAKIICSLKKDAKLIILSEQNGWYKVTTSDNKTGWVSAKYVAIGSNSSNTTTASSVASSNNTGTINASSVNLRSGAGTSYKVIGTLGKGCKVDVIDASGTWYKVNTAENKTGWVSKKYVTLGQGAAAISNSQVPTSRGGARESTTDAEIVIYAKGYLNTRYAYGGNGPNSFDCSGFTKYVFKNFGINLNRIAADQAKQGIWVSKDNLKIGDLVFFDTNGGNNYINHAGIYIGNGQFIHASSGSGKVVITDMTAGYYLKNYMSARRVLN